MFHHKCNFVHTGAPPHAAGALCFSHPCPSYSLSPSLLAEVKAGLPACVWWLLCNVGMSRFLSHPVRFGCFYDDENEGNLKFLTVSKYCGSSAVWQNFLTRKSSLLAKHPLSSFYGCHGYKHLLLDPLKSGDVCQLVQEFLWAFCWTVHVWGAGVDDVSESFLALSQDHSKHIHKVL